MIDKLAPLKLQTSSDERSIGPTEMIDALNITVTGDEDGDASVIKNIKGTIDVPGATPELALPLGENMVIGSTEDETLGVIYLFVWNSGGNHGVWAYSSNSRNYRLIFQDPDGTYLNFERNGFVKGDLVRVRRIEDDQPIVIWGCTNPIAQNYNPLATLDDGSCFIPTFDPDEEDVGFITYKLSSIYFDFSITAIMQSFGGAGIFENVRFDEHGSDYIKSAKIIINVLEGTLYSSEEFNEQSAINSDSDPIEIPLDIMLCPNYPSFEEDGCDYNGWVWGNEDQQNFFYPDNINPSDIIVSYKVQMDLINGPIITETISRTRQLVPTPGGGGNLYPLLFEDSNLIYSPGSGGADDGHHRFPECWNKDQLTSRHAVKDREGPVQGEDLLRPFANATGSVDGLRTIVDFSAPMAAWQSQTEQWEEDGYGVDPETGGGIYPPVFSPTCFSSTAAYITNNDLATWLGPTASIEGTHSLNNDEGMLSGDFTFRPTAAYSGPGTLRNRIRVQYATYHSEMDGSPYPPFMYPNVYGFFGHIPIEFQPFGDPNIYSSSDMGAIADEGCDVTIERQVFGAPQYNGPISEDLYDSRWVYLTVSGPGGAFSNLQPWWATSAFQTEVNNGILVREFEIDYRNMIFPEYAFPNLVAHFCYESCLPCITTDNPEDDPDIPDFDIEGDDYNLIFNICDYLNPETNAIDIEYSAVQFNADVLENDWGIDEVQAFSQYVGMSAEEIGCPNVVTDDEDINVPFPYTGNLCDYPRLLDSSGQQITLESASSAYIEVLDAIAEGGTTSLSATYDYPDLDGDGFITIQDLNLILGMANIFPIDCSGGGAPPEGPTQDDDDVVPTVRSQSTTSRTTRSKTGSKASAKKAAKKTPTYTSPSKSVSSGKSKY